MSEQILVIGRKEPDLLSGFDDKIREKRINHSESTFPSSEKYEPYEKNETEPEIIHQNIREQQAGKKTPSEVGEDERKVAHFLLHVFLSVSYTHLTLPTSDLV